MNILGYIASLPLRLLLTGDGNYTISATAPRILLNNSAVMDELLLQYTTNPTNFNSFKSMVETEVAYETANASDYASGSMAAKVAAGYGNIYHMGGEIASNVTYWSYRQWQTALMYFILKDQSGQSATAATYAQHAHDRIMEFIDAEEYFIAVGVTEGHASGTSDLTRPRVAYDSYLDIGPILGDIMMVLDFTYDVPGLWTDSDKNRICALANQALSNLWGNKDLASFGGVRRPWNGWSATNPPQPGNNYYFSFLKATAFTGLATYAHQQAQAAIWLAKFRDERILTESDPYYTANLSAGGSQEGTGYGIAMRERMDVLGTWEQSTGEDLLDNTTHTINCAPWLLHNLTPGAHYLVNVGDHARDKSGALYDYHAMYMHQLGYLYPTNPSARACKYMIETRAGLTTAENSHNRWSWVLMNKSSFTALDPAGVINTTYYNTSTGYLASRTSWAATANLVTFMAGPYVESHAHQDQGSFMVYRGDVSLFDDQNVRSHSGIQQHLGCHNLLRFDNGSGIGSDELPSGSITQVTDTASDIKALADNSNFTYIVADIKPVYDGKAQVVKNERELLFIKPGCVIIFDRANSNSSSIHRVFTLNMEGTPTIVGNKLSITKSSQTIACHKVYPTGVSWTTNAYTLTPQETDGTTDMWPGTGTRAEQRDSTGTSSLFLNVVDVNNTISTVTANSTATETGVNILFTSGATLTVQFNNSTTGGTMSYLALGGSTIFNGSLPNTVTVPPILV